MDNAQEAFARRGAPFTFDPHGLLNVLRDVRERGEAKAPSFDHAKGDPLEGDISIEQGFVCLLQIENIAPPLHRCNLRPFIFF